MFETQRLHLVVKGTVQGVGFRFYAERIANKLSLVGFVKNLSDGNVEVMAEGERENLDRFLEEINTGHLGRYIIAFDKTWAQPTGEFEKFGVQL